MRSILGTRTVMVGVVLVVLAAALAGAYALAGSAPATTRQQAPIWLGVGTTTTGHSLLTVGGLDVKADLGGAVVRLYKRDAGQNSDTYVGKATVSYSRITGNLFHLKAPHLTRNCIITAVWAGNGKYFGSRSWAFAGVKPRLSIAATQATETRTRLRIDVAPLQPSHGQSSTTPETFASVERLAGGVWTSFPGDLGVASTDGESWCAYNYFNVPAGTYTVRAHFKGTNYNAAAVSKPVDIVVP